MAQYLNRSLIESTVKSFPDCNITGPEDKGGIFHYIVTKIKNNHKATLRVYFNNDGTTTLASASGNNAELFRGLTDYLTDICGYDNLPANRTLFIKKLSDEYLDYIIEFLREHDCTITEGTLANGRQFKIVGINGDSVNLNHFTKSKSFQVQGNGAIVKLLVIESLSGFIPNDEIIKIQLEQIQVESSVSDIIKECREIFPTSYDFLGNKLITIISASIIYRKTNLKLPEYSSFVQPCLRTLEGYLKRLFEIKEIAIGKDGFGIYFEFFEAKHHLTAETILCIGDLKIKSALELCYNYYVRHRHGLSHIDKNIDQSRIIETAEKANQIIEEVINIIEQTYLKIKS